MSNRIEIDPEATVLRWLMRMDSRTSGHDHGISRGDVGHRQVQVDLLGVRTPRPGGLDPVVDPLKGQRRAAVGVRRAEPTAWGHQRGEVPVRAFLDVPAEDLCVELAECKRIGTIKDDKVELGLESGRVAHVVTLPRSSAEGGCREAPSAHEGTGLPDARRHFATERLFVRLADRSPAPRGRRLSCGMVTVSSVPCSRASQSVRTRRHSIEPRRVHRRSQPRPKEVLAWEAMAAKARFLLLTSG